MRICNSHGSPRSLAPSVIQISPSTTTPVSSGDLRKCPNQNWLLEAASLCLPARLLGNPTSADPSFREFVSTRHRCPGLRARSNPKIKKSEPRHGTSMDTKLLAYPTGALGGHYRIFSIQTQPFNDTIVLNLPSEPRCLRQVTHRTSQPQGLQFARSIELLPLCSIADTPNSILYQGLSSC
jgi:hypothetical protein